MRIISLHPLATDILDYCGVGWDLVGVTHVCAKPTNAAKAKILTVGPNRPFRYLNKNFGRLASGLCEYPLDIEQLKDCVPNVILADIREPDTQKFISWAQDLLRKQTGLEIEIKHLHTDTLEEAYQTMLEVGELIGKKSLATTLVEDIQEHVNAWAQSYSMLCKGKKVLLLSETEPFEFESGWVDDLIHLFGAETFSKIHSHHSVPVSWQDIVKGRPDVIVVAPHNTFLTQSVKRLSLLEGADGWEELPAVKRGQVFFASGMDLYRPGPKFLKGIAAFVSAMAGLEKPILEDQESFFRIRQVEMFRHKLLDNR
jgi:iron complex transport system substrate-binding protein